MHSQEQYMKRCLELAAFGKGHVAPNPMVGAILVYNGRIIGEGWHEQYGQSHAEVNCIENVKQEDKYLIPASTMYVNLEPCSHHGNTPPCVLRLVQEKVKEVIVCNTDPFEKVAGMGLQILKDNGIDTTTGIAEKEGSWFNRRFFCVQENNRPYIILKWAQSANGIFAPYGNKRYQISNAYSTKLVHKWRTEEAAIMVGTNTALADNPQLTARLWKGKQPLRIVIDRSRILPNNLKLFNADAPTWIINDSITEDKGNVKYVQITFDGMLLESIMQKLYEAQVQSVIIEGGATLLNSFIAQGLWDEARVFTADNTIAHGIAAPKLHNAAKVLETDMETDTLQLYINNKSRYPYVQGMEL